MPSIPFEKTEQYVLAIIDAARDCFDSHGYTAVTDEEIADAAGLDVEVLHKLFPSRDEIIRELAWRDISSAVVRFSVELGDDPAPDEILMGLCKYIFADRIHGGRKGEFSGLYHDDETVRDAWDTSLKRIIANIYDQGRDRGMFKPLDTHFMAECVTGMLHIATKRFIHTEKPVNMFNDSLSVIADMVAYKDRIPVDKLG